MVQFSLSTGMCLSLMHSFGVNPKFRIAKFDVRKLEAYVYHMVED